IENILLIASDVTQQIVRERAEREQKELVALFQRITGDRAGFEELLSEATALVASLEVAGDPAVEKRAIHTLKGNCAIYGFERYAELCHEVESQLAELDGGPLPDALRARLIEGWRAVVAQMSRLLGERTRDVIEIDHRALAAVDDQARQGMASRDLAAVIASWSHEAVGRRFERLAQHATGLARRLRKGEPAIEIDDARIRVDGPQWAPFWSAAVHAIRNAVDHGIESPDERRRAGKPARPVLRFVARRAAGQLEIAIGDDGRGIDWAAVRRRAEAAGLPAATRDDLVAALFADGVSTRASASDTSGRGVGMAALRDAVSALGGEIDLETADGAGTTWRFRFPSPDAQILPVRPPTQPIRRAG
ncbi:MAG: ATP-binding protein, partial [Kofleriaceae bacterium]